MKKFQTESHQRLNVEKHFKKDSKFSWLVGLTDGDGSFSIDRQVKAHGQPTWNLVFKISLNKYNIRALIQAKKILGAGTLKTTSDGMSTLRIRDREKLKQFVFPIFDRIPLLSNKHYDYIRIRHACHILDDKTLSKTQQRNCLEYLYSLKATRDALAPIWSQKLQISDLKREDIQNLDLQKSQVDSILSLSWVLGFIEAEGSFYITVKDKKTGRYCHGFGLTQAGNRLLMEAIRVFFKIKARVKDRTTFYCLDTTNWRNLEYIQDRIKGRLLGIKSQEFRVWERSMKYRNDSLKLQEIQALMRRMRKNV